MATPDYLPDVPGVMMLVKEKGLPELAYIYASESDGDVYVMQGVFYVKIRAKWTWDKDKTKWAREYVEESINLCFDLWTGEELSLSDFFPEGYDYLGYLNKSFEERIRNDFEYMALYGPASSSWGSIYDETIEYDGGKLPVLLKGDEQFGFEFGGLCIWDANNEEHESELPFFLPSRSHGEKICEESGYEVGNLGYAVFNNFDLDYQGPLPVGLAGNFDMTTEGGWTGTVTVYAGELRAGATISDSVLDKDFSEAKILEYAKKLTEQWKASAVLYSDLNLFCMDVTLCPRGYYIIDWDVYSGPIRVSYLSGQVAYYKGKPLSLDEMFDVPFEEVLAELVAGMRIGGSRITAEEDAAEIAKAFRPYFVSYKPTWFFLFNGSWSWDDWVFLWKKEGEIRRGKPSKSEVAALTDLKEKIPIRLWQDLTSVDYSHIQLYDPYIILKHLKMYEGYPFD